ncbi:hypothetical protein GQ42DRAFT_173549 [Ramicandelaber brevisporus]|nr:hypothetical protein GQ42DRAFT_173549 [Ramicandelaber brevisporus]
MKPLSITALLVLLLAAALDFVAAALPSVAIAQPFGPTVWTPGENVNIVYDVTGASNATSTATAPLQIELMQGDSTSAEKVATISSSVVLADGRSTIAWNVPSSVVPGRKYFVRIGSNSEFSYSHHFEVAAAGTEPTASVNTEQQATLQASPTVSGFSTSGSEMQSSSGAGSVSVSASALSDSAASSASGKGKFTAKPSASRAKEDDTDNGDLSSMSSSHRKQQPKHKKNKSQDANDEATVTAENSIRAIEPASLLSLAVGILFGLGTAVALV